SSPLHSHHIFFFTHPPTTDFYPLSLPDALPICAMLFEMLTGDPPHTASTVQAIVAKVLTERPQDVRVARPAVPEHVALAVQRALDRKSTRLNSSHLGISYAVFCLKKKKKKNKTK